MISNLHLNFPRTEQKAQFSKSQSQKDSSRDLNLFTLSISVHFLTFKSEFTLNSRNGSILF